MRTIGIQPIHSILTVTANVAGRIKNFFYGILDCLLEYFKGAAPSGAHSALVNHRMMMPPKKIQRFSDDEFNFFYNLPEDLQISIYFLEHKRKSPDFLKEIRMNKDSLEERWLEWSDEDLERLKKCDFHNDLWERTLYTMSETVEIKQFNEFKIWLMKLPASWRTRRTYSVRRRWTEVYEEGLRNDYSHLRNGKNPYFTLWKAFMQHYFE